MSAARSPSSTSRNPSRRSLIGWLCGALGAASFLMRRTLTKGDDDESPDGTSVVAGAPELPPYESPSSVAPDARLAFLALGDIGWPGPVVQGVAARMERVADELPFSFVCLLGDNFYRDGVDSSVDPRWRGGFEELFAGSHLDVPFYAALGNHDHNGIVQAQVEYTARSSRWRMPAQYYSFALPLGEHEVEFFVLDTEAIRREERESDEQLRWLEEKLAHSRARWKIAVGHHPLRSNGAHGGIGRVCDALEETFVRHGVALYLSGHDHDLELLDSGRGYLQVVSGAGSSSRSMRWGDGTVFASAAPGFVWVALEADVLELVFVEAEHGPRWRRRIPRAEFGAAKVG